MRRLIQSILDTDLYKLTMQQAVLCNHIVDVHYKFFDRTDTVYPDGFVENLRWQIGEMERLSLSPEEEKYLRSLPFIQDWYVDFLKGYRFNSDEVLVNQTHDGQLEVEVGGPWHRTILWETPLLATISELYYIMSKKTLSGKEVRNRATEKVEHLKSVPSKWEAAEFGTRRRYSFHAQQCFLQEEAKMKTWPKIIGTSNVHLARTLGMTAVGTTAHEYMSFHGAKYGYRSANRMALENWTSVYDGDLGIALIDTYTTEVFLRAFNKKFAKLFDGVRQDSGDPLEIGEMVIEHYRKLDIDPTTKTIVFSDGLNPDKAREIYQHFRGRVGVSFGIGTNLTNNFGFDPINIVIKMVEAEVDGSWRPVIKLSDSEGKHTGDEDEIQACQQILQIG